METRIEYSQIDELIKITSMDKNTLLNCLYHRNIFVDDEKKIHKTAIIGDHTILTGDITIGPGSVIFYGVMIQADKAPIKIGEGCCIVDGVIMHNNIEIGDYVHIAHGCLIHRRRTKGTLRIGSGSLIGFGSQIHESVGKGCQIAPGIIVNQQIPDYHFVYEKNHEDGIKQLIISPMRPQNYERIIQMYKSFWGRHIILKGQLIALDWKKYNGDNSEQSFNSVIKKLRTFFLG